MEMMNPQDLLQIGDGSVVTKRNLYDLIQYSKVEGSAYWGGENFRIGNTPQQGINWLGELPNCHAVLIKTREGSYAEDGWQDEERSTYHYSLKATKYKISYTEKANLVLLRQREHGYPILLFSEAGKKWRLEGRFDVSGEEERFVVLKRRISDEESAAESVPGTLSSYTEGTRSFVRHLRTERNRAVVAEVKASRDCVCDICDRRMVELYGVECIEAHHAIPIGSWTSARVVTIDDFVLLCPNCHSAVHKISKGGKSYAEAKQQLLQCLASSGFKISEMSPLKL